MTTKVTYSPSLGQFGVDGYFVRVGSKTLGLVEQYELRIPQMAGRVLLGHQVYRRWRAYRLDDARKVLVGWDRCPTRKQATAELLAYFECWTHFDR